MPTTTTGESPVGLSSSTRTSTVGLPVVTGSAPLSLGSSSSVSLTVMPAGWTLDVSQSATVAIEAPSGVGRVSPPLATPPANLTIPGIPYATDAIDPLTVDGDGRVHSDGT